MARLPDVVEARHEDEQEGDDERDHHHLDRVRPERPERLDHRGEQQQGSAPRLVGHDPQRRFEPETDQRSEREVARQVHLDEPSGQSITWGSRGREKSTE